MENSSTKRKMKLCKKSVALFCMLFLVLLLPVGNIFNANAATPSIGECVVEISSRRRTAAHGCRPETVEKIREEAQWLHETATAYPDRLLRRQFEYEMKYAFKCEGYKE